MKFRITSILFVAFTDTARASIGDRFVDDGFYFGRPWEIGLRRFAPEIFEKGITLKILPLRKNAPIYIPEERLPEFGGDGEAVDVSKITLSREYEVTVRAMKTI
jgi:beta-galactosidase